MTSASSPMPSRLGLLSVVLFAEMWIQLALMPVLHASPTGILGRIFPAQVLAQFAAAFVFAVIAGVRHSRLWLAVALLPLSSLVLIALGVFAE